VGGFLGAVTGAASGAILYGASYGAGKAWQAFKEWRKPPISAGAKKIGGIMREAIYNVDDAATATVYESQLHGPTPLDVGPQNNDFGPGTHPISGQPRFHDGIDIGANTGTRVPTVRPGVVSFADRYGAYGNYVQVTHADGTITGYAHLSKIHVKVGDTVFYRQVIGEVGSTGGSTGPHLHFSVFRNGAWVNPLSVW